MAVAATTPDGVLAPAAPRRTRSSRTTARPLLSVIIVNFRQWEHARALIRQLDASDSWRSGQSEILLIDNDDASESDPAKRVDLPRIRRKAFGQNRGFSRAVNEGCRLARGEWLLLLNPDLNVPEEFLDQALRCAEDFVAIQPNAGIIGYRLRHADGSPQGSSGPEITFGQVLRGALQPRAERRCVPHDSPHPVAVPWVTGCCMLVRRACWEQLGGFDEDFFLYYEDVDLCRRARAAGYSVWYEPRIAVAHLEPLHLRQVPPPLRVMTRHALLTYASKHWHPMQCWLLGQFVRAEATVREWRARWLGQRSIASQFSHLRLLAAELLRGQSIRARARLLLAAKALSEMPQRG